MERPISLNNGAAAHPYMRIGGVALSFLSGLLLYLALPPHRLGYLAWIAFLPGLLAQFLLAPSDRMARLYQAMTYSMGIGLTVVRSFPLDLVPTTIPITVPVAGGAVLTALLVWWIGLPTGNPSFHRRTGFRFFIVGPATAWVGFEFLRMLAHLGQIWGQLSTTQQDLPAVYQIAALGGGWLVSLLIVAANYALGLLILLLLSLSDRQLAGRWAWGSIVIVLLLVAAGWAWGATYSPPHQERVRVAALQPGHELGDVDRYVQVWSAREWNALSQQIIPDMAAHTRHAAAQDAQLIVWPEATLWLDPPDDRWTRQQLVILARETDATLVIPYFIMPPHGPLGWWLNFAPGQRNEALLVTPGGEFLGPYAKNHPIPFIGERSSTSGRFPVHRCDFGRVATMLGYDVAFTDVARRLTREGAQLLTLSTHDWVGMSAAYAAQTRLRAVENGVSIVRTDWEVGSLIVNTQGQVVAQAPYDRQAERILIADVPLPPIGGTIYTRIGDAVGIACLAATGPFLLWARCKPRSGRSGE